MPKHPSTFIKAAVGRINQCPGFIVALNTFQDAAFEWKKPLETVSTFLRIVHVK